MKIVVAGRFDYIRFAWENVVDNKTCFYFEDGDIKALTFKNKFHAKIERLAGKLFKNKAAAYKNKNALREYFDIDALKRNDEILFIVYETNFLSSDINLLKFLKGYYPKSKFILQFTNAIGTVRENATKKILDNINFYDVVYTFNQIDAVKYGFKVFPDISGDYSTIEPADCEQFDVFYAGRAKGRLNTILDIAEKCVKNGLKTKFFITEVPEEQQRLIAGAEIIYNQFIPYKQMLSYIKKGKAVLNVLAGVSNGIILRDEEAIGMNKVLITDCEALFNSKYYTEEKVIPVTEFENQIDKIKNFDQSKTWICTAEDTTVKWFLELIKKDLFYKA